MLRSIEPVVARWSWLYLMIFCPVGIAYAQDTGKVEAITASAKILRIAPSAASDGIEGELFDSIRYVPLETIKESEFREITQLMVTRDRYIILDKSLDIVLFFDKSGHFIHKIAPDNKDIPTPYSRISYITVNEQEQTTTCFYLGNFFNYCFDLNGSFLRQEHVKMRVRETIPLGDLEARYYSYRTESTEPKDGFFPNVEIVDSETGRPRASYLYFDTAKVDYIKELLGAQQYFYRSGQEQILFTQPYNYTIYALAPSGILTEKYRIILPMENSLPVDFLTNTNYNGRRKAYIPANRPTTDIEANQFVYATQNQNRAPIVYSFTNLYQVKEWLTFRMAGKSLLYNVKTDNLYNFARTELSNWGFPSTFGSRVVLATDGIALISSVDFRMIKKFYEESPYDDRLGLADLKGFLKKDFRNPILQLSYLKN